jgi:hypothetical protein
VKFDARCPHCDEVFTLTVNVEKIDPEHRKGPKPHEYGPEIDKIVLEGVERYKLSLKKVGVLLEERGIRTPRGHLRWYPASVRRLYEDAFERRAKAEAKAGVVSIFETKNKGEK